MTNAALGQLFTTFAYAAGAFVFWLEVRRKNMATEGIRLVALAGLCGGVLGAKLSEWFVAHASLLLTQPQLLLDPRMGGRTVIGGVLGGWLCVEIAKKRLGIRRSTGDSFALALPLGETIGRIGCFFNGCCYGVVCSRNDLAVWQHGAWRVPTQFVLGAVSLAIFCVVLTMRNKLRDGESWLLYLSLFGASRFVIEFWRERSLVFGALSLAQIVCLVLAISSTQNLWHKVSENEKRIGRSRMENSLSYEKEIAVCEACGAPISPRAATCPTCRVSLVKPEPARVAREIALYVAAFFVVTLLLISVILLRRIYFFAVLMQGVLPFVVLLILAFVVVRFWKR